MQNFSRFKNQKAIVTGGSSGIGLAIARRLRAEGATVAVFDFDPKAFAALGAEFGTGHRFVQVDVTDETRVNAAVGELVAQWGGVDILVNSAGITGVSARKSHEITFADFERVVRVNLFGSFLTAKAVLPGMVARRYGRILHIASIAGKDGNAGMVSYSSSKAAVIGMTKSQGKEYAESGITINALAPAVIQTPLVDAMPPEQVKANTDKIPMKRCGTLDEIAAMACFIVSPETSFTTGFTFDLSGGRAVY
jgi:NAD(P)-dependent dehydrogenase (short-subunit alcohol dehydrogenase family)